MSLERISGRDLRDLVLEKAAAALRFKAKEVRRLAMEQPTKTAEEFEREKAELISALQGMTKTTAQIAGAAWDPRDYEVILAEGEDGVGKLMRRYGVGEPEHLRRARLLREMERERRQSILLALELCAGGDRSVRSQLYELLPSIGLDSPFGKRFFDLLEPVTQGVKSWLQFQSEVRTLRTLYLGGSL